MAAVAGKIDSNSTNLRIAEEETFGVLPSTPVWEQFEPNTYGDFGGDISRVARRPINDSRQLKKGVVTDLDAGGGFNTDFTQNNLQNVLQGLFFADLRRKGEEIVTSVDVDLANPDEYRVAATAGFKVDDLIQGQNFTNAANNAVNVVTIIVADTSVEVADGQLVDEASPPANAQIVVVGVQGAAGDIDVDASGALPVLTSTLLDFTTLGLIQGEWFFIGGDLASERYSDSNNNGFARIRTIAANALTLDKTDATMVTEASTTETIRLFFGRVLRNEQAALQVCRSYQPERTLGDSGTGTQSEYLPGSIFDEMVLNIPSADKLNADLTFVSKDHETRNGTLGVKSGTRPALASGSAVNTSSDFSRIRMAVVSNTDAAPTGLALFLQDLTLTVANNSEPNKAIATLGAFAITAGAFEVTGSVEAYFYDIAAIEAVRANSDVTIDLAVVASNTGFVFDIPLLGLGDGRLNVEIDTAVILPLNIEAGDASDAISGLDYTAMFVFFDFLPNLADV